ncbi:MAG: hypothetical protein GX605_02895 [Chloroflexi bacterium]|nr:hypothetical protein [Chloroflexota bacterium]
MPRRKRYWMLLLAGALLVAVGALAGEPAAADAEEPYPSPQSWAAGQTAVSDLTWAEKLRLLGLTWEEYLAEPRGAAVPDEAAALGSPPSSLDWRNVDGLNWTTAIRDQRLCGACAAFGALGAVESRWKIFRQRSAAATDLSESHLFFCGCGQCCDTGWTLRGAFNFVRDTGVVDEACFPYTDQNTTCSPCSDWANRTVHISQWQNVSGRQAIKQALTDGGPVVVSMMVYADFYNYTGGVYRHASGGELGPHAVTLVGYNDRDGYWIAKNSWGAYWGESGWFRIAYGECDIENLAFVPLFSEATPTPTRTATRTPTATRTSTGGPTSTTVPATLTATPSATATAAATPTRTATASLGVVTLQVEAEDLTLQVPMAAGSDGGASACGYIYSTWTDEGEAAWTFTLPRGGWYRLWVRGKGTSLTSDSFYYRMDAGNWLTWAPPTLGQWVWAGLGSPVYLQEGAHTLRFRGREPYAMLDRVELSSDVSHTPQVQVCGQPTWTPTATQTPTATRTATPTATTAAVERMAFEAEVGGVVWPMTATLDESASGCFHLSSGVANRGHVSFGLPITAPNTYFIFARGRGESWSGNSFWVSVDGGAEKIWEMEPGPGGWDWLWDQVLSVQLAPGSHTLTFRAREAGAHLDRVEIASAAGVVHSMSPCGADDTATVTPTAPATVAVPRPLFIPLTLRRP